MECKLQIKGDMLARYRFTGLLTTRYLNHDHWGSATVQTDEAGNLTCATGYDAFGNPRDPSTGQSTTQDCAGNGRGYTNQMDLPELNLIHLNGRVYDPQVGRFISADPTVPAPLYTQAFDRYAYVYDNPLAITDPTGFSGEPISDTYGTYHDANGREFCQPDPSCWMKKTDIKNANPKLKPLPTVTSDTSNVNAQPLKAPAAPVKDQSQQQQSQDGSAPIHYNPKLPQNDGFLPGNCGAACGEGWSLWDGNIVGDSYGPSTFNNESLHEAPAMHRPSGTGPKYSANHNQGTMGWPMGMPITPWLSNQRTGVLSGLYFQPLDAINIRLLTPQQKGVLLIEALALWNQVDSRPEPPNRPTQPAQTTEQPYTPDGMSQKSLENLRAMRLRIDPETGELVPIEDPEIIMLEDLP